jgi:hypothetical protein
LSATIFDVQETDTGYLEEGFDERREIRRKLALTNNRISKSNLRRLAFHKLQFCRDIPHFVLILAMTLSAAFPTISQKTQPTNHKVNLMCQNPIVELLRLKKYSVQTTKACDDHKRITGSDHDGSLE